MTQPIATAIAGSLPKPAWLAQPEKLWAPWQLSGEALEQAKADAMRLAVDDQLRAGITIIGDGEQTRQHFVTTFIEHLEGVDFVNRKTVRIRDRYDADVPRVVGPVSRKHSVFVEDARRLRLLTGGPIKFTLPGPMTMIDTLCDEHFRSREKLAWAFAEILNQEAQELAAAGVDIVQFDEPAFNVFFDEVRDWGVKTLERAAADLPCKTAVHICYGYGIEANIKWKEGLGAEWRQYEQTFPLLAKSHINQISLECQNSHVPMELIGLLDGKEVMVGAIDVASNRIETPEEVAATLRRALQWVKPHRLIGCTNCGMVPLPRAVARGKLYSLAAGAAIVRAELGWS
jgi:5-methyltetrahydropteroyltriglutamate--homocysteine methyltransferase